MHLPARTRGGHGLKGLESIHGMEGIPGATTAIKYWPIPWKLSTVLGKSVPIRLMQKNKIQDHGIILVGKGL